MNSCMIVLDTDPQANNGRDDGGDMDTPMPPAESNVEDIRRVSVHAQAVPTNLRPKLSVEQSLNRLR